MEHIQQRCVAAYREHRNLKVTAQAVGIPWQTVYVHLRRAGEPVTGDKTRYGSSTDKLAAKAERHFLTLLPEAEDQNKVKFQSKVDFRLGPLGIDVKASRLHRHGTTEHARRWTFSVKKQEAVADFFVCFGYCSEGNDVLLTLLIPGEIARMHTTISVTPRGGKWLDYAVEADTLPEFFRALAA